MSIIVHGMEMPEDCIDCFAESYNECLVTGRSVECFDRPDWCPLEEVPKHGRWIDDGSVDYNPGYYFCSVCGESSRDVVGWEWCPYCGARMEESE